MKDKEVRVETLALAARLDALEAEVQKLRESVEDYQQGVLTMKHSTLSTVKSELQARRDEVEQMLADHHAELDRAMSEHLFSLDQQLLGRLRTKLAEALTLVAAQSGRAPELAARITNLKRGES